MYTNDYILEQVWYLFLRNRCIMTSCLMCHPLKQAGHLATTCLYSWCKEQFRKHYWGCGGFLFLPVKSGCPHPRIGRKCMPFTYFFFKTPLYVFCGLIWANLDLLIISIWRNLGTPTPLGRLAKSEFPLPIDGKIWVHPTPPHTQSLHPSNRFWVLPNIVYWLTFII